MKKNILYNKIIHNIAKQYQALVQVALLLRSNQLLGMRLDWLTISAFFILGYALFRSGLFLFIYLLLWNFFPPSQFFLIFNPIPYEIYLLLLSFFIAWYSLRLLIHFPKQFQIHLLLFQQLKIENLQKMSEYYLGVKTYLLEGIIVLLFFWIIIFFPHFGLYFIWCLTLSAEIFCFLTIRKPQILLFNPTWIKNYDDFIEGPQKKGNEATLSEENLQIPLRESFLTLPYTYLEDQEEDAESNMYNPMVYPYETNISHEEFEHFFGEQTFLPPDKLDIYDDEFADGWVNWFWLNFWYKILPLLAFINIIIFILLLSFGIPELWKQDMQITYLNMEQYLDNYQYRILHITDMKWTSSWKWVVGGVGFRSYINFFSKLYDKTSTTDIYEIAYMDEMKQYLKYTYYILGEKSRQGKIYNECFPLYYWYMQLQNFFFFSRLYPHELRPTFFYKFLLYHDLAMYKQIKSTLFDRFFFWKKKNIILKWLFYRANSWVFDYYYVAPAINVFPEKYFRWLTLVRMLFVIDQLNLNWDDTILSTKYWLADTQRHYNVENDKFFLQEYIVEEESPEITRNLFLQKDEPHLRYSMYTGVNNFIQKFSFYLQLIAYGPDTTDFGMTPEIDTNTFMTEMYTEPMKVKRNIMTLFSADTRDTGENAEVMDVYLDKETKKTKKEPYFVPSDLRHEDQDVLGDTHEKFRRLLKDQAYAFELGGSHYYTVFGPSFLTALKDNLLLDWKSYGLPWFLGLFFESFERIPDYGDILTDIDNISLSFDTYEDEDKFFFLERMQHTQNSDYAILEDLNYSTNIDIVPLLRENTVNESLQDTDLYAYMYRDDPNKTNLRKRNFLEPEMLQMFAYLKSWRNKKQNRSRLYDAAGIFNLQTISPKSEDTDDSPELSYEYLMELYDILLDYIQLHPYFFESMLLDGFRSYEVLMKAIESSYTVNEYDPYSIDELVETAKSIHPRFKNFLPRRSRIRLSILNMEARELYDLLASSNISDSALGMTDNKTSREKNFRNLQDLLWYRYYYKVDSALNYYDLMPTSRKFYMQTWPLEYLDSKYNYYGTINTIDHASFGKGRIENGFLIYDDLTDLSWYSQFFNNEIAVDQIYLYLF